jgi:hypothetical protein
MKIHITGSLFYINNSVNNIFLENINNILITIKIVIKILY